MIGLLIATQLATGTLATPDGGLAPTQPTTILQLRSPRWVRHRVGNGERLVEIAGRYGVTIRELREWNRLEGRYRRLPMGKRLRVKANRLPPPRVRSLYTVQRGDTWSEVGIRHGVDSKLLRALNLKSRSIRPGTELQIWIDPGRPKTVGDHQGPPVPARFTLPWYGESKGRPQMGRLINGVQLPESDLYTRRNAHGLWGSSHALLNLQLAIANFRHDSGFEGEVIIGAISRPRGGRFYPHRSHQSGRDVDIRLPVLPGVGRKSNPWPEEVDWDATWGLVDALVETEQIKFIFLERKLHRWLYEAARRANASHNRLSALIDSYDKRRYTHAIIRHAKGHDAHIHVRFVCSPHEANCDG